MPNTDWILTYLNAQPKQGVALWQSGSVYRHQYGRARHDRRNAAHDSIVDDDEAVRDSLQFLLGTSGHITEVFVSAAELLKSEMHRLACLILDHHMPHMTGLKLLARLRDLGVGIPVLLITGSPSSAIAVQAAALGVERVLEKPPSERGPVGFVAGAMR